MAFLVLDLDLTLIATKRDVPFIDTSHELSDRALKLKAILPRKGSDKSKTIRIINPQKTADMIQNAYQNHDGIIFLTAGCWVQAPLMEIFCTQLSLTESVKNKLRQSYFLSVVNTAGHFPNLSLEKLQLLPKSIRLKRFVELTPEFKNSHFVVLDDSRTHCNSFKNDTHVIPVLATTVIHNTQSLKEKGEPTDTFYTKVANSLIRASYRERVAPHYPHLLKPRWTHFWNKASVGYENSKKSDLLAQWAHMKGDTLKGEILTAIERDLSSIKSSDDLRRYKNRLTQTAEYKILSTPQGFFTRVLGRQTDSIKAAGEMMMDKEYELMLGFD